MNQKSLHPDIVNQLDNLYLKAKLIVEGFMSGLHKSPYHGFSVEFSEHRPYGNGDEIKNIDWKIWGKTVKYYIKRFEEETNLACHFFLDSSKSMQFKTGNITKFDYAKIIAAGLSYLMIQQRDALGLCIFDSKIQSKVAPKSNKSHLNTILSIIDKTKIGGDTNLAPILSAAAEKIKKRGLIILLSDLLDNPQKLIESLKHFKYNNNEVLVFHILDPKEIELKYNNHTIFKDLETREEMATEPWQIQEAYNLEIQKFIEYYKKECFINKIDYNLLITNQSASYALLKFLNKRKKSF